MAQDAAPQVTVQATTYHSSNAHLAGDLRITYRTSHDPHSDSDIPDLAYLDIKIVGPGADDEDAAGATGLDGEVTVEFDQHTIAITLCLPNYSAADVLDGKTSDLAREMRPEVTA